jgi:hypothetical protein
MRRRLFIVFPGPPLTRISVDQSVFYFFMALWCEALNFPDQHAGFVLPGLVLLSLYLIAARCAPVCGDFCFTAIAF